MLADRSGEVVVIHAPAKINLFFELLAKRDDGYHEIETLMMPVSLCDTLRVQAVDDDTKDGRQPIRFQCLLSARLRRRSSHVEIPLDENNLVVKALRRLRQQSGCPLGAEVTLIKRIPSQAGLGGGSSDAAAALIAANSAWQLGWSNGRMATLGAELGSDIPFFFTRAPAICRGRGERVETVKNLGDLHLVIVKPSEGLSTAEMYRKSRVPSSPRTVASLLRAVGNGSHRSVRQHVFNRLQTTVTSNSKWFADLRKAFNDCDCIAHQMTGSGSAYFGICRTARHARAVAGRLMAYSVGDVYTARSRAY